MCAKCSKTVQQQKEKAEHPNLVLALLCRPNINTYS